MRTQGDGGALRLDGLVGQPIEALRARLGAETSGHWSGADRWLVYERPDARVRVRLVTARDRERGVTRVASWTVTFRAATRSPGEALDRLGLSGLSRLEPAAEGVDLWRGPLAAPGARTRHSLTATVRDGRVVRVSAFDEPPEWLPAEEEG